MVGEIRLEFSKLERKLCFVLVKESRDNWERTKLVVQREYNFKLTLITSKLGEIEYNLDNWITFVMGVTSIRSCSDLGRNDVGSISIS